jgi:hypothetical protein
MEKDAIQKKSFSGNDTAEGESEMAYTGKTLVPPTFQLVASAKKGSEPVQEKSLESGSADSPVQAKVAQLMPELIISEEQGKQLSKERLAPKLLMAKISTYDGPKYYHPNDPDITIYRILVSHLHKMVTAYVKSDGNLVKYTFNESMNDEWEPKLE